MPKPTRPRRPSAAPALLAAVLAAGPLSADDPNTWDVHLGALWAQGEFRDDVGPRPGIDTGLSLTVPLGGRLDLRPRISREQFRVVRNQYLYTSSRYTDRGFEAGKWTAYTFGADVLFHPRGAQSALYLLAGAHLKAWRLETYGTFTTQDRLTSTRTFTVDDASTSNEPAACVGAGVVLRRELSIEARMTLATYRKLSYNTLHLAVVGHF